MSAPVTTANIIWNMTNAAGGIEYWSTDESLIPDRPKKSNLPISPEPASGPNASVKPTIVHVTEITASAPKLYISIASAFLARTMPE